MVFTRRSFLQSITLPLALPKSLYASQSSNSVTAFSTLKLNWHIEDKNITKKLRELKDCTNHSNCIKKSHNRQFYKLNFLRAEDLSPIENMEVFFINGDSFLKSTTKNKSNFYESDNLQLLKTDQRGFVSVSSQAPRSQFKGKETVNPSYFLIIEDNKNTIFMANHCMAETEGNAVKLFNIGDKLLEQYAKKGGISKIDFDVLDFQKEKHITVVVG